MYVNEKKMYTSKINGITPTNDPLKICFSNVDSKTHYYNGELAEVRIYNYPKDVKEIKEMKKEKKPDISKLVLWYQFFIKVGVGEKIQDLSGKENHGILMGGKFKKFI
jgi:tryptophanyl-tRNA synthetase